MFWTCPVAKPEAPTSEPEVPRSSEKFVLSSNSFKILSKIVFQACGLCPYLFLSSLNSFSQEKMSSPKKSGSSSSSDNPDQYLISGSLDGLPVSVERSVSSASVAGEASSKAIVLLKSVEEDLPVDSSAQKEGEVSTSAPPQATPAAPQATSEQVVPPTPQTQGELSEEERKQLALVEQAREEERQKKLKEKAAGKKPAPDTPQASSKAPKLMGSSMAADAAVRQRQAAADEELTSKIGCREPRKISRRD